MTYDGWFALSAYVGGLVIGAVVGFIVAISNGPRLR